MNLVYAEILETFPRDGLRQGKVRVGGAIRCVPLELVADAQPGDTVLLCDGVALSRVQDEVSTISGEPNHVSGHSRKNS